MMYVSRVAPLGTRLDVGKHAHGRKAGRRIFVKKADHGILANRLLRRSWKRCTAERAICPFRALTMPLALNLLRMCMIEGSAKFGEDPANRLHRASAATRVDSASRRSIEKPGLKIQIR
jgi:hypothetical protein